MDEDTKARYDKVQRTLDEVRTEFAAVAGGMAALTRALRKLDDALQNSARLDDIEQRIRALEGRQPAP